jgi:hypothetical protein
LADPRRQEDDEPLTQLDVDIDKKELDSLIEREATTSPGGIGAEGEARADDEPQTMEPPRVMGVPRLRAHTMLGVAPPSSGATAPPTTQPDLSSIPKIVFDGDDAQDITETKPADIPKIQGEGDDEQTTMVGKLLAEAHAQVAKRLKEKEPDLYADETATTVGDAEKLIAAAKLADRAAGGAKARSIEGDEVDEPTESRSAHDALMEDTTSRRDAINIDDALARAAELRAEAERKKRQAKKRTIHGLGDGPLKLPAKRREDEIPTFENKLPETGERPASTRQSDRLLVSLPSAIDREPADGEMETLSAGVPHPAPMRSIGTEPETMPVQVPSSPRERLAALSDPSSMLVGPATPQGVPFATAPGGPSFDQTMNLPPNALPYTQPMPYAPTVRMDEGAARLDPALRQTQNSPMHLQAAPLTGPLPMTPSGGVPHFHSTPMPVQAPQYSMQPHSGPAAFARTAVATGSGPAVVEEKKKKKGGGGIIFFLLLLVGLGGIGYWQRAVLKATWDQYRRPAPVPSAASAAPTASASIAVTASAAPSVPPPVATESAAPHASSSAAPHGSASAAPSSSASTKPPVKKTTPWKPPPRSKTGTVPKPVPKPVDDNRGF